MTKKAWLITSLLDTQCQVVLINESGYIKEKCLEEIDKHLYKCPFEDEYFEIEKKFLCNTDPRLINDTTGKLQINMIFVPLSLSPTRYRARASRYFAVRHG